MKKEKQPSYEDAEKCIKLRKQSKQGFSFNLEDQLLCEKMYFKYPKWYSETDERVFNETVPYGSSATWADWHKKKVRK